MSEPFVTVATYNRSAQAQLAKNLLAEEGILSTLSGELTADMLPFGQAGGGDQITLQVSESDAQRAAGILAAVAAAKLDENWEEEAESGSDVWLCSICGEPISNRLSICYSCKTPREGIRASAPRAPTAIQPEPDRSPSGEEIQQKEDDSNSFAPVASQVESEGIPLAIDGDDLARKALIASMFGILLPLGWYYLAKLFFFPGELSPKGMRYLYAALLCNACYSLIMLLICGGLLYRR